MGDGTLSQDEIDALLSGASDFGLFDEEGKEEKKDEDLGVATEQESAPKKAAPAPKAKSSPIDLERPISLDSSGNMGLLLDIKMNLTVELGRTKRPIKDVLGFGRGTVVELEKLNGEPVDIMVNGRLIARGEVVVIDESYGVRVTEIIDPLERYKSLE